MECGSSEPEMSSLLSEEDPMMKTRSVPVSGLAGASTRNQQMMKSRSAAIATVLVTAALLDFIICRSEEHTSELQSRLHLVCRLLLEKKKKKTHTASQIA